MSNELVDCKTGEQEAKTGQPLEVQNIEAFIQSVELRVTMLESLKRILFKCTRVTDWITMGSGDKVAVYLEARGAISVAASLGIGWGKPTITKINLPEGHYEYEYTGNFNLGGRSVWVIGSRASSDPFFVTKHNKPAESINHGHVKKAAFTNWVNNGIKTLLGIKNITPEDLEKYYGMKKGDMNKVDYTESKKTNVISTAQKKRLYAIGKGAGWTDDEMKAFLLKEHDFKSSGEITRDKYDEIVNHLEGGKEGE